MKQNSLDDLMIIISRLVVIIPVVIILVGVFLFLKDKVSGSKIAAFNVKTIISPTPAQSPLSALLGRGSSESATFNLKGPLFCDYTAKTATISARVKNKNVFVSMFGKDKISSYLLKEDCLYMWDNDYSGKKMCGLSQYVSLFESLSSIGIVGPDMIISNLSKLGDDKSLPVSENDMKELLKTCKKEPVDDKYFSIPAKVLFKNEEIPKDKLKP